MSSEEYDSYVEYIKYDWGKELPNESEEREINSILAENYNINDNGEELKSQGENGIRQESDSVLQGEKSVSPVTDEKTEGESKGNGNNLDSEHGTLPESPSGGEPEVKEKQTIEQLITTARGDESLPETIKAREELSKVGICRNEKNPKESLKLPN